MFLERITSLLLATIEKLLHIFVILYMVFMMIYLPQKRSAITTCSQSFLVYGRPPQQLYTKGTFYTYFLLYPLNLLTFLFFGFLSPLPSPQSLQTLSSPPLKRAKPDSKAWTEQHDCILCGGNDCPDTILICDKCDEGSHLKCLWLEDVPDTKYWFCDFCISLK
jgi:hypothetical protein